MNKFFFTWLSEDNAKKKCAYLDCKKQFHEICSKHRGLMRDDKFYCYNCYIKLFILEKKSNSNTANLIKVDRTWLDYNT